MIRLSVRSNSASVAAVLLAFVSRAGAAELPNASAAATGLSDAYTARARGYDAVAWNPANLGLAGNPGFSLGLFALHGSSGLDPVTLSDFAPYSGKALPSTQREQWLQTVTSHGGENGSIDGGMTWLGLSAGPVAVQIATSASGATKLTPDAFEAIMFGNAGRTGSVRNLDFQGSSATLGVFTTAAASYGVSFGDAASGQWALGVTGKYIIGNALAMAQDQGSTAGSNVSLDLPLVYSHPDSNIVAGSGAGLDVGLAWSNRRLTLGAVVQNVMNTFVWDPSKLSSKAGTALYNGASSSSDFDDHPYASAPAALRAAVSDNRFRPVVAGGVAYALGSGIVLSADGRQQLGDGITFGPKTQIGSGVELRGLPILRLRAGAAYLTGGWGVSTGAGLDLGPFSLGVGGALRAINGAAQPTITISLLSIR